MATTLTPSFYRPSLHGPSRSFAPLVWGEGALAPGWPVKDLFSFDGSAMTLTARADTNEPEDGNGFISSGLDSNGNIWLLSADGGCYSAQGPSQIVLGDFILGTDVLGATTGQAVSIADTRLVTSLPYDPYTGGACSLLLTGMYVVSAAGEVFHVESGVYTSVGTFGVLVRSPTIQDGKLYVTQPTQAKIGIMDLTSFEVTTQAAGMDNPAFCAVGTAGVWVVGTDSASHTEFSGGVVLNDSGYGAAFSGDSLSYVSGTDPDLNIQDTVTVPSSILQVVYLDNPAQVVALTESALYVYSVESGSLVLSQTLTVSGGSSLASSPDQDILVVGTSAGTAVYKEDLGSWSLSSTVGSEVVSTVWCGATSLSSDSSPTILSASGAAVTVLSPSGDIWASVGSISLAGTITGFASDTEENIVASGVTGSSGYVALLDLDAMDVGYSTITSEPILSVVGTSGSKFYALSAGLLYSFQYVSGSLAAFGSSPVVSGDIVSWTGYSLWVGGAQYQVSNPGTVTRAFTGMSALVGESTATWSLGVSSRPSGLLLGSQNAITLLTGTTVATQALTGADPVLYDLQVFSGQSSGTPMNLSGAVLGSAQVIISTSASGEIIVVGEDW